MRTDFRQGIITYPVSLNQQVFLAKTGSYVSLQTANGRTDITFAHGTENYLYTESSDVTNAWGPFATDTDYWLYWDINTLTAVRTFGYTTLEPIVDSQEPAGVVGLHWFNTTNNKMYVYQLGGFREVIRVFASKLRNNTFTGMGSTPGKPFAGSQVGLNVAGSISGRIIVDDLAQPIRRTNGLFFTTENDFFVNGSPVNSIRLEANVLNATALENMARYQIVKYTQFGKVNLATYNDIQVTMIAICMEDLLVNQTGTLVTQGTIDNPNWSWETVGASLWITGAGLLTDVDPHITDPTTYPTRKSPIGRVITPTSIFFDQNLGGIGDVVGGGGTVVLTGDVTGSGTSPVTTTLATLGTAGTYTKVSTDSKGRVVTGELLSAADVPSIDWSKITSGKPTTVAGYGITDAVVNAALTPSIYQSAAGSRPAGTLGQLFIDTTNDKIQRFDGTLWVDIGVGSAVPNNNPTFTGIVSVENLNVTSTAVFNALTITTTTISPTVLDSFNISEFSCVEYTIQIKRSTTTHITKILLTHNGTNAYMTEYGTISTGVDLGSFDATIIGSSVQLSFTATSTITTVVKALRIAINA